MWKLLSTAAVLRELILLIRRNFFPGLILTFRKVLLIPLEFRQGRITSPESNLPLLKKI